MRRAALPAALAAAAPVIVFLLALAPRLAGLGSRPFWYDEVLTAQRAALPLQALARDAFSAHHTPVYFLLAAPFTHSSDPQFWLRLPSAILGALGVMLVYRIAARAAGSAAGIAAALCMGLAPIEIAYSQEARSYTLMVFLLLVALHGLCGLALRPKQAGLPWRSGGVAADWLQFTAGTAAALSVLADSLPWLLAANVTGLLMLRRSGNLAGLLRNFLAADAIALACSVPLYVAIWYFQRESVEAGLAFVPGFSGWLIWFDVEAVYLMRITDSMSVHFSDVPGAVALATIIGLLLVISCLAGIWRLRRNPLLAALLPAFLTLPVLLGIISLARPLMMSRYILWSGPPFAILAGIGIGAALSGWRRPARIAALAALAALLLVNLLPFYRLEMKPRWDIAARIVARQARAGDVFFFDQRGGGWTTRYYLPVKLQPLLADDAAPLQHAIQAHARGQRVWAVYGDAWPTREWESLNDFQTRLAPLGLPSAQYTAGGRIILYQYDPPAMSR